MSTCRDCRHAKWHTGKTGGGLPEGSGSCRCPIVPHRCSIVPAAFYFIGGTHIGGGAINYREPYEGCPRHEPRAAS